MNQLTKFLVDGILNEGEQKTLAAYGGGFKPPTDGHFEVVKKALKDNPEIDEFIIYVGSGERNGITQAESILIWEVYQTYLPMKVKIEPSKAPIGDVLRLGKNNPQDKVYFVIGAREDNEGDLEDIKNRTRAIGGKHPNMEVKVITTKNEGMSGTNARKAAKVSFEDFAKFLPTELSNDEKETVYNIVKPVVKESLNEDITKPQLDALEAYADNLFSRLGIDIEFTKHFLDRLNDKRNIKPISIPELIGMFKRLHKKHGKPLSKVDSDFNAVVKDFNSNINIPFAINVTPNDIDLVAKTVMRKKDFKTSTPVISLEENASYSQDIDIKQRIMQLTQHMLDKGYNIEPLPSVELVDGDSVNAREFFGKTAYYDPNSATIVLYTEGRHPKDIVRSFSHEMIHHIQNLEGRLDNITTTNTQEDDALNDIEAEANLKGTMTFRNWTDSLNEGPQFGVLYHYSEFIWDIIDDNILKGDPNVSLTRSKGSIVSDWLEHASILVLDKDKLRQNYKITPFRDQYAVSNMPPNFPRDKKTGKFDEMEEVVKGDIKNIDKYIIKVILSKEDAFKEEFIDLLKEKGIPYEINKPLNEAIVGDINEYDNSGPTTPKVYIVKDDALNDIEAEANLKGTMTFRNWTDSLNENLNDGLYPFKVIDKMYDEGDNSLITVEYEFITPNNSYRVEFYSGEYSPESKTFDLSFGVNTGEFNTIDTFQMTGEGNARKILKTIRNIIEDFIDKEDVEKIIVDGTDEKRKRIYKAIFSKLSNKIEIKEANLKDTTLPRNWANSLNENILPQEKFAQETNQDYIEQSLKILPNKDKYNLKDYTVEILPIGKVKPTQFGEDYINASSEYEAEQYQKYIDGEIEAEDLRREDFYPIVVDKDTMEILDGNHRHAVHTMLSIPKIKAILVSKKLNEANKPYKHKHGFDDKLGNDPFGISAYARELASGLEEEINKDLKNENIAPDHDGKSSPFGSGYKKVKENIKCSNCGWEWKLSNGGDDPYLCHKCGHDNKPNLMEGRYDTITNKLSKIIFEAFKDMHDRGEDKGEISLTIGPNDEDIISNEFEFDLEATVEFGDDDQYGVDGGANVGFDDEGEEVTPLLSVRFKIPKNPKWNIISFDIKDVVRHELEHLTQEGENLKSGKFIKDDQILRNLIDMKLLSKAEYFKLEKEVDAMLQGMYFKAKKSKTPFKKVLNDYLDIFVDQKSISKEEKDDVLNIWRSRRKALSLPPFE